MKKSFHVFFLFVLFAFFAVNAAWAATLCPDPLQEDGNGGCYINMPATGETSTINITAGDIANGLKTFKVYDAGGKDGNYSSYSRGSLVLIAPADHILVLTGSVESPGGNDRFIVYDGAHEEGILLHTFGNDPQINQRDRKSVV